MTKDLIEFINSENEISKSLFKDLLNNRKINNEDLLKVFLYFHDKGLNFLQSEFYSIILLFISVSKAERYHENKEIIKIISEAHPVLIVAELEKDFHIIPAKRMPTDIKNIQDLIVVKGTIKANKHS